MQLLRQSFSWILSAVTCSVVFISVAKLILFLSTPLRYSLSVAWFYNLLDNRELTKEILSVLGYDAVLVILFILSHSLCKTRKVKDVWAKYGLADWERSVYNLISSTTLLFLIIHWKPLAGITVWEVDVFSSKTVYWTYNIVHGLCWAIICFGSILMDLPELLGVKQIYCEANGLPHPMLQKTAELRRLLGHIRHPSFLGLLIVLWAVNIMTLDRVMLASLFTLYMYLAWNPDIKDCAYQRSQLSRKKYELNADLTG